MVFLPFRRSVLLQCGCVAAMLRLLLLLLLSCLEMHVLMLHTGCLSQAVLQGFTVAVLYGQLLQAICSARSTLGCP